MNLAEYQHCVKTLSDRLIELQRPIRILDAIKWPALVKTQFMAAAGTELPQINKSYYEGISLGFEPAVLRDRFKDLRKGLSVRHGASPTDERSRASAPLRSGKGGDAAPPNRISRRCRPG
jgi:hypothetical protein